MQDLTYGSTSIGYLLFLTHELVSAGFRYLCQYHRRHQGISGGMRVHNGWGEVLLALVVGSSAWRAGVLIAGSCSYNPLIWPLGRGSQVTVGF